MQKREASGPSPAFPPAGEGISPTYTHSRLSSLEDLPLTLVHRPRERWLPGDDGVPLLDTPLFKARPQPYQPQTPLKAQKRLEKTFVF